MKLISCVSRPSRLGLLKGPAKFEDTDALRGSLSLDLLYLLSKIIVDGLFVSVSLLLY